MNNTNVGKSLEAGRQLSKEKITGHSLSSDEAELTSELNLYCPTKEKTYILNAWNDAPRNYYPRPTAD